LSPLSAHIDTVPFTAVLSSAIPSPTSVLMVSRSACESRAAHSQIDFMAACNNIFYLKNEIVEPFARQSALACRRFFTDDRTRLGFSGPTNYR
jgi:hypothetical protein